MTGADDHPPPASAGNRNGLTLTAGGTLAAVAILAVAIAVSSVRETGDASASDGVGAFPPEASVSAQPSRPPATTTSSPAETAEAAASPQSSPAPAPFDQWAQVAAFGIDDHAEEVDGLAYAASLFIAIGHQEPLAARGAVGPPQDTPLVWSSTDGRTWSRVALDESFTNAHFQSVVALPGGDALIYGIVTQPGGFEPSRQAAWRSADGVGWEEVALTLPGDSLGPFIVAGERGYATAVTWSDPTESVSEVWHSADGVRWEVSGLQLRTTSEDAEPAAGQDSVSVRDLAAGDEGFVAAGVAGDWTGDQRTDTPMVFASGDGREWTEAVRSELPDQPTLLVAALGSDWILTATDFDTGGTTIWWSVNGLEWEQRSGVEVPAPAGMEAVGLGAIPIVGDIVGAGRRVVLTGVVVVCCHSPVWAAGVWSSVDGHRWDPLALPADAVVTTAVERDGVTVLAGHTGASPEAEWKAVATFWASGGP